MEIRFYDDEGKGIINADLMSDDAQKWAVKISNAGLNAKGDKLEKNKISQLRKFYDEATRLSTMIREGEEYRNVIPFIKMLKAKAAYAEGRKLTTSEFTDFIGRSIAQVKTDNSESYELFMSFFEAFIGFYKFEESKFKQ